MTITDQIKILNKKIKQNEAQYNLNKNSAIISVSSSKDLVDKCEYLTVKYLALKSSTIEKVKFEYSPLGKVFTKGLNKHDQKDGLLKSFKNIEDKNEELLKATKNNTKNIKEITNFSIKPEKKMLIIEN